MMDVGKINKPIVMAKPVRGREMQSTIIPKDVVDTVRAVSTKQIRGESIVENLQKPREGDVEVYHEGYIDGKLYLVPDSNLQAMRDIVNLKMKRRHSSAEKPHTSLDEPTQYTEFKSKLNGLLGKIDRLADSSNDESESMKGSEKSKQRLKKKKRRDSKEKTSKASADISSSLEEKPEKQSTESAQLKIDRISRNRVMISPMMDENISYIRVRPKGPKKLEKSSKGTGNFGLQVEERTNKDKFYSIEEQNLPKEFTTEKFKLLISGHLKNGSVPVFINHQNYTGPNILEHESPDFKTHKREGNIDIFISGKFFTSNILKEESFESPAILDVKTHKIVIDKDYDVHRKKFKDIYKVGPLEVALEDNFPMENMNANESPTAVLYSEQNDANLFKLTQQNHPNTSISKHVHYASGNKETSPEDTSAMKNKSFKDNSVIGKLKNNKIYKKIFSTNEENIHSDKNLENASTSSSQQMKARSSKIKREELARLRRSRLKDRKATRGQNRKLFNTTQDFNVPPQQVFTCDTKTKSLFETRGASTDSKVTEEGFNTKKVKKIRKQKKKDKNQAIVENPILAQMQEFFIA